MEMLTTINDEATIMAKSKGGVRECVCGGGGGSLVQIHRWGSKFPSIIFTPNQLSPYPLSTVGAGDVEPRWDDKVIRDACQADYLKVRGCGYYLLK